MNTKCRIHVRAHILYSTSICADRTYHVTIKFYSNEKIFLLPPLPIIFYLVLKL